MKKRKDFESGAGANNERFFKSKASLVNDDESQFHTSLLPPPTFDEFSVNLYDGHLGTIDDEEHPSQSLRDEVLWSELKTINASLHKTYRRMKHNMSVSGNHDSDPFNYTGAALGQCAVGSKITAVNMYYFYMQMTFNSKLCIANQVTLPQSQQNISLNIGEWESKTPRTERKKQKIRSNGDKGDALKSDKDDALNSLILMMRAQFDNRVQHDVKTQVYDCTEKMRSDVKSSMTILQTYLLHMDNVADNHHRELINSQIDHLEKDIKSKNAMLDKVERMQMDHTTTRVNNDLSAPVDYDDDSRYDGKNNCDDDDKSTVISVLQVTNAKPTAVHNLDFQPTPSTMLQHKFVRIQPTPNTMLQRKVVPTVISTFTSNPSTGQDEVSCFDSIDLFQSQIPM